MFTTLNISTHIKGKKDKFTSGINAYKTLTYNFHFSMPNATLALLLSISQYSVTRGNPTIEAKSTVFDTKRKEVHRIASNCSPNKVLAMEKSLFSCEILNCGPK